MFHACWTLWKLKHTVSPHTSDEWKKTILRIDFTHRIYFSYVQNFAFTSIFCRAVVQKPHYIRFSKSVDYEKYWIFTTFTKTAVLWNFNRIIPKELDCNEKLGNKKRPNCVSAQTQFHTGKLEDRRRSENIGPCVTCESNPNSRQDQIVGKQRNSHF